MGKGGKKSSDFTEEAIESLAKDKPVVYQILNKNNKNIYTGSAKRGRVEERLKEHLPGGPDPIRGARRLKSNRRALLMMHKRRNSELSNKTNHHKTNRASNEVYCF